MRQKVEKLPYTYVVQSDEIKEVNCLFSQCHTLNIKPFQYTGKVKVWNDFSYVQCIAPINVRLE